MPKSGSTAKAIEIERCTPGAVYPMTFAEHGARYRLAADLLRDATHILDVASGTGIGGELLARTGRSVTGVEMNRQALEYARTTYMANFANLRFVQGNVLHLPIRSSSMPAITAFEIVEHVRQPDALLAEIRRVLVPGGSLLISSPEAIVDRLSLDNPFHVSLMTGEELRARLERNFKITGEYFQTLISPSDLLHLRKRYRRRWIKRIFHLSRPLRIYRVLTRNPPEIPALVKDRTFSTTAAPDDPYAVRPIAELPRGYKPYIHVFHCAKET